MIEPSLSILIDRTSLALSPLEFSGQMDETVLGIVNYQPPALLQRLGYMQDHPDVDGSELTSQALQKTMLNFDWVRDNSATETQVQASYLEVLTALCQFSYTVTTQVSGAPPQVWVADPGDMTPAPRSYVDLLYRFPVYAVSIPVQPIPGA